MRSIADLRTRALIHLSAAIAGRITSDKVPVTTDALNRLVGAMMAAGMEEETALRRVIDSEIVVKDNDLILLDGKGNAVAGYRLFDK